MADPFGLSGLPGGPYNALTTVRCVLCRRDVMIAVAMPEPLMQAAAGGDEAALARVERVRGVLLQAHQIRCSVSQVN